MRRLLQVFALLLVAVAARPVMGFSLAGPLGGDPGGEAWQTVDIGYGLAGDIVAPKNLGEEYRWNIPVITYGFDPTFINYFGTNGIAAVEAAIAVYNSLPDVSTLSQTLNEYPLKDPATGANTTFRDSRRVNYTASALNLLDIKTMTMGVIAEELGLISPERFTWTLRARALVGALPVTNYFVIMRNFDPVTYTPSRYVNGNRLTYNIVEIDNPFRSYPLEFPADPESALYGFASVANLSSGNEETGIFPLGVFYNYLTRDDIGGLRYIYDRDNLNWESFAPGTQITAPDFSSITLLTNLDLFAFSDFTFRNPPAAVLAQFPNLVIRSNSSFITTEVQVVGATLTNSTAPWDDPLSGAQMFIPILQTNPVIRYIYSFANVVTNYFSPTTILQTELIGFQKEPWSTPDSPVYRTNRISEVVNLPNGGILIVPTNIGQYNFTGFAFTNVIGVTNVVLSTNVLDNGFIRPLIATEVYFFTNVIFGVFPFSVQPAPPAVLRGGVGKLTFKRLGSDAVFGGTNFIHTNIYTITYYTNSFGSPSLITNTFSIAETRPGILFGSADLGISAGVSPFVYSRTDATAWQNNGPLNTALGAAPAQGGPGNIFPPIEVVYNRVGPGLFNQRPGVATEEGSFQGFGGGWVWGSFDGSTNPPVVYPKDITLEDVELLINGGLAP
jgi:hypothetical protein